MTQALVITTSSLATALFFSIMLHIFCGIYCLLKSRFKKSPGELNDSELRRRSCICQAHQNPLMSFNSQCLQSPHSAGRCNSIDHISNCRCSLVATAGISSDHSPLHKISFSNMNGLQNCSFMRARSFSNPIDMDVLEESSNETSRPSLNENMNVIYKNDPNLITTFNAGFPLLSSMRELYQVTERSLSRTVCGKLIVSVTHLVTDDGDTLYLDNTGISLHVPPGAIGSRQKQLISLVLNWDLSDNPEMNESQSLVSPVVYCGPHGLHLKKSCVLTYKHCAYNVKHLDVMISETELCGQKSWQPLKPRDRKDRKNTSLNEENVISPVTFTQDECQVNISTFTLYTAVMTIPADEDVERHRCGKWLQVAVFSYPLHSDGVHHQARIYFLNKTPCALQWAIQNESKFGGSMCCPEKVFLFNGNHSEKGKDIFIRATYMSENWELIDDADDSNTVPFVYIWHGKCPYTSMCFRRKTTTDKDCSQELSIQFFLYQENMEHAGEKLDLHTLPVSKSSQITNNPCEDQMCMKHRCSQININVSLNKGTDQTALYEAASHLKCQRIPQDLRLKLRLLLDPPCTFGNNWKLLASEIGLDSSIRYLSTTESPTEELMDILEQKMSSLDDLRIYLKNIDRLDAMKEVDEFIAKKAEDS